MSTSFYDVGIWEEIRSIVSWKTDRLVENINKEILQDPSLVAFQGKHPVPFQLREIMEQRANAWVQRLYDPYCDAYKSRGKTLSAEFDRAVWFYRIEPFIMGETDSQIHSGTMGGFLNLLLCAVGSPPEKRPSLTVNQKECCFDVRTKVYEGWHDKLHHLPPRINEAAAVMAQANERMRRAALIAAGLPPDNPPPPPATPEHTFRWEEHGPKPTEILSDLPVDYPRTLVVRTFVIIAEAVRKFPVQTRTLELCKYVISELTSHFRKALRDKVFQQDQALSTMHDLLHHLVVHNCGDGSGDGRRSEVEKEVRKSDEWLTFAKEIANEIDNDAPVKAASIQSARDAPESLAFTVPSRLPEDQAGETNELSLTVCAVCGHYEAHHDQAGCSQSRMVN